MRLKLRELKNVVDGARADEADLIALREEVTRSFGPTVLVNVDITRLAENINDRLDVLEHTGRSGTVTLRLSTLNKLSSHKLAELRRVAARLLPEQYLGKMTSDPDSYVRHAVAKRVRSPLIKKMLSESPDDELMITYRKKRLIEQKEEDVKKRLGDDVKQQDNQELSDQWYVSAAHKAISDYNHNIEGQWDESWVARYCSSVKATNGVDVDPKKLWDEIQDQLTQRDDELLGKYSLKETIELLRENSDRSDDNIKSETKNVLRGAKSSKQYLREVNEMYAVSRRVINNFTIPIHCRVPHDGEISTLDESVLDAYTSRWNDCNPRLVLSWRPSTSIKGDVVFDIRKK